MVVQVERLIIKLSKRHVEKHNVRRDEIEEVARGSHMVLRAAGKKRLVLVGMTQSGRILEVVIEPKGKGVYYVVTAYPAGKGLTALFIRKRGGELF